MKTHFMSSMKLLVLVVTALIAISGIFQKVQAEEVTCVYKFFSADLFTVKFDFFADGSLGPTAQVSAPGSVYERPLQANKLAENEFIHATIGDGSPDDSLELIVYENPEPQGKSKLINPSSPFAKELWGDCVGLTYR